MLPHPVARPGNRRGGRDADARVDVGAFGIPEPSLLTLLLADPVVTRRSCGCAAGG